MTVQPLVPDVAPSTPRFRGDAAGFAKMVDGFSEVLQRAQRAEEAFAAGSGDLQQAMYERARADVVLSVAAAGAQRAAQALQTVLNMQV